MGGLKRLTQTDSFWQAVRSIWQAGLQFYRAKEASAEPEADGDHLKEEFLDLSRLVHDYETKILNTLRANEELRTQSKELERAYLVLRRENRMLKEDLIKLKRSMEKRGGS